MGHGASLEKQSQIHGSGSRIRATGGYIRRARELPIWMAAIASGTAPGLQTQVRYFLHRVVVSSDEDCRRIR